MYTEGGEGAGVWMRMDLQSNIVLIPPRAAITSRYIGCGVAACADSCIDFRVALDLAFYVYDTCARLLLHDFHKGLIKALGKT